MSHTVFKREYSPRTCINPKCKTGTFTPLNANQITCLDKDCTAYRVRLNGKNTKRAKGIQSRRKASNKNAPQNGSPTPADNE